MATRLDERVADDIQGDQPLGHRLGGTETNSQVGDVVVAEIDAQREVERSCNLNKRLDGRVRQAIVAEIEVLEMDGPGLHCNEQLGENIVCERGAREIQIGEIPVDSKGNGQSRQLVA